MLFGQMSFKKVSTEANYIQLDVCGLSESESVARYVAYQTNLPVILHGDWTKKGNSENNIKERVSDYVAIINSLRLHTQVIGLTIHPTFRKKVTFEAFVTYCDEITKATGVPVFIENRSNDKIWLSRPQEIIEFSQKHLMTIDLPQLYISCAFDDNRFIETLKKIKWENVREMHIANIKRQPPRTFVARKLDDGELDFSQITCMFATVPYGTFEILGGVPTFDEQVRKMNKYLYMN